MNNSPYFKAVEYLDSLFNLPQKEYLLEKEDRSYFIDRLAWFLKSINNPHKGFKIIHVTGTAGKGSTTASIHYLLQKAGKKVGSFYSPHPTTEIERIKVGDKYIAPDKLAEYVEYLKPYIDKAYFESPYGRPSFFETFFAIGFLYFKEMKCEYVVLEAGLGGKYDASNVIDSPVAAVITNIDYDHTEILGKTLTKIAKDKAGIIKKGTTFFTCENRPHLLKIFKQICHKHKVPLNVVQRNEISNHVLAKAVARHLGVSEKIIKQDINLQLPCRFEKMQDKPLVIIDGAHNPIKLGYLAEKIKKQACKKVYTIFALKYDKDIEDCLKNILPVTDELILTRFLTTKQKAADLENLISQAKKIKPSLKIKPFLDPWQALDYGLAKTKDQEALIITGSFYLAGRIRTRWHSEEKILKTREAF